MNFVLIFLFSIASVFSFGQRINSEWKTFTNEEDRYKFSYPDYWEKQEALGVHTVWYETSTSPSALIKISFERVNKKGDKPEQFINDLVTKAKKELSKDFYVKTVPKYQHNNYGILINLLAHDNKTDINPHTIIWLLAKGKSVFSITYKISDRNFDQYYLPTVDDIFDSFSFLDESQNFDSTILKGRWEGTRTETLPESFDVQPTPFILIIKSYDEAKHMAEVTQIYKIFKTNTMDTGYNSIPMVVHSEWMQIPYYKKNPDQKECQVKLQLDYSFKNGYHYLEGSNKILESLIKEDSEVYCLVSFSLKK